MKTSKRGVYLVDPGTDSNLNLLPLGVGRIASYCRVQPGLAGEFDISVRYLRVAPRTLAAGMERPVVAGLAAYVWNMRATLAYAEAIRAEHPDCLIVLGGASIPKREDRARAFLAAHPVVDVLVQGEGEITFAELLEAVAEGRSPAGIRGLSVRDPSAPGGVAVSPPRTPFEDLNQFPSPFLDGIFDGLMKLHADRVTGALIESNRGCPYSCTFCDWGGADLRKINSFDPERTKAEVDWVGDHGIPYIFLADANFGIFFERDLSLADHIAACFQRTGNPRFLGINFTKNSNERVVAIAERLLSGGIQAGVTLAAQSFHPPTLAAIKRRNMDAQQLQVLRDRFREKGIVTYNDLILALPEETKESFLAGIEQTMTFNLKDQWVVHLCNILENAEMAEPDYIERYGIETRTCAVSMTMRVHDPDAPHEEEVIVVATRTMPQEDWVRTYDVAYLCAALHNFRAGFFVMNLLKARFGVPHTEFAAYFLDATRQGERWPALRRCVDHLEHQRGMILGGVARYSPVAALGGFNATPQEALLAMFLDDADAFYGAFKELTRTFLESRGLALDGTLLEDLFLYQSLRMTTWQEPGTIRARLRHDLPAYFEALERSPQASPAIAAAPCDIEVIVPASEGADRFAHARLRTRGARYTDVRECRVHRG
ncbi:MAG: radical SAM protein [Alphaproteobacteria bacterium]|nr:radical SAM protein [Alphaproteobacteria bacterium]